MIIVLILIVIVLLIVLYFQNKEIKKLKAIQKEVQNASAAKTDFLSSMSHEIRTPLNAILGFSQGLLEENLPEATNEEIKDIVLASNNLLEIVNGILDISKIEAQKLEIISVDYNFHKLCEDLKRQINIRIDDKPIILNVKINEEIPTYLYGDSLRVKQIIANLLTNAVKYTQEGQIDFFVDGYLKNDMFHLIVEVKDTGKGIKENDQLKLFKKFERLEEDRNSVIEGTGLGLSIVKKLLELMNGSIRVVSEYKKGSTFTVELDQKISNNKEIIEKDTNVEILQLNKQKILLVDDNLINLKVGVKLLTKYDLSVETTEGGFEAIEKVKENKYDLILLDDMMPEITGTQTLVKLKEIRGFETPVIALTANAITGMREKYIEAGFDDYISKPIEQTELIRVLNTFIDKGE
ncbi:MAG: ATP-binding protein [Mycoplasmatota bacterium]